MAENSKKQEMNADNETPPKAETGSATEGENPWDEDVNLEILGEVDSGEGETGGEDGTSESEGDRAGGGEDGDLDSPQRITELEAEVEALKEENLRRQADFINYRQRLQREKEEFVLRANQNLIEEVLPVLDNFELALSNGDTTDPETYRQGVELIRKQLLDLLTKYGLEPISCLGETFDPNIHEAVAVVKDPAQENQRIVRELKKGYYLNGRLIRSPMVQVVVNDTEPPDTEPDGDDTAGDPAAE